MSYVFSTGNTKRLAFSLLYMTQPQQAVQYSQCLGSIKKASLIKKPKKNKKHETLRVTTSEQKPKSLPN